MFAIEGCGRSYQTQCNVLLREEIRFADHVLSCNFRLSVSRGSVCQAQTHVDQVIGNNTQTDPALHAIEPAIETAVQPVPSL